MSCMKTTSIILLCGFSMALAGCGKKEEPPPPPPPQDPSVKENIKEAAGEFKETADGTARKVGGAFKNLGSQIGEAFKEAKDDLSD